MPRTAAQYPSTTSPASSAPPASPGTAQPVASKALSVRSPPRSLPTQASGVATAGRSVCGVSAVLGRSAGGVGSGAAAGRRSSSTRPFDGAQSPHFPAHLDLRSTVHLQHWLGHITEKVVVAIAMRDALKLGCDRLDEGILLVRHPHPHRLVQALGPLTGQRNQSPHLLGCTRKQGLSKPYPLPHELAYHV